MHQSSNLSAISATSADQRPGERTGVEPQLQQALSAAMRQVNELILGNPETVRLTFCSLLAGGHLLIEDLPGLGKTTLANALAVTLGLDFHRIQFTSDLLPADVVGISIYSQHEDSFRFQRGPIFSQLVLADEINRAPPRTQSALLEAMAENHVTIDGKVHALPTPFFVIATQNPVDLAGTWLLPDSQLDRFLFKLSLGYPSAEAERQLLQQPDRQRLLQQCQPQLNSSQLLSLTEHVRQVHVSEALLDYLQRLIRASRQHASISAGLSPRAALALLHSAQSYALMSARDHVLPDDIKAVFVALAAHRLKLRQNSSAADEEHSTSRTQVARELLDSTPVD